MFLMRACVCGEEKKKQVQMGEEEDMMANYQHIFL